MLIIWICRILNCKNKAIIKIPLLCLFLLLFTAYCNSFKEGKDSFTLNELHEDFNELRSTLENEHPSIYLYDSPEEMNRFFDSLDSRILKDMTEIEFYRLIVPVIAKVKCGHTVMEPSDSYKSNYRKNGQRIPFRLYSDEERAYIFDLLVENPSIIPGAEIISLNGISPKEILRKLLAATSSDGYNETYKLFKIHRDFFYYLDYIIGTPDSFALEFINPGSSEIESANIRAVKASEFRKKYNPFQYPVLYQPVPFLKLDFIDSLSTALLRVASFHEERNKSFINFLKNSFEEIKEKNIKQLIIDLRGNNGGDPEFSNALLAFLLPESFTYLSVPASLFNKYNYLTHPEVNLYDGNLYVLIDGGCFSSTGHFCSLLKYYKRAEFIGEETGGSFYCNDNSEELYLGNTGIYVRYARTTFATGVKGFTPGRGIKPDIYIKPSIQNILMKQDTAKIFVLNRIKDKRFISP